MPKKSEKQLRLPFDVYALQRYGGLNFEYRPGAFDPGQSWELIWQIWLLKAGAHSVNHHGFMRLKKEVKPGDKSFHLTVEQQVLNQFGLDIQQAQMTCAHDAFATPLQWEKSFRLVNLNTQQEVAGTAFSKKGRLRNRSLEISSQRRPVNGPVSSSWSLPEALQRLSRAGAEQLTTFILLDDLDKVKEDQQVRFVKEQTIAIGGQQVPVRVYQHTGQGLLPCFYYLDEQGRLLLAISGLRAYILNPDTLNIHRRVVQSFKKGAP